MVKKAARILAAILCFLSLVGCVQGNEKTIPTTSPIESSDTPEAFSEIPEAVMVLLDGYMEAARSGFHKSAVLDLCYNAPGNEFYRQMDEATPLYLLDCEIDHAERINEKLYAFTLLIKKSASDIEDTSGGYYDRVFNFVGEIGGTLYIIKNIRDIPDDLKEDFDPDLYSYEVPYDGTSEKPIRNTEPVSLEEVLNFYEE